MVKMTIGKSDEQDMGLKGRELTGSRPPPKELRLASGGGKPGFNPPEKTGKKQAGVHVTHPGQTRVRKAYIYLKVPHLRLPGIVFRDGWFSSDNHEEQAIIEQHP